MEEIKFNKKQIKIFKEIGIEAIYLFGSRANGTAHKMSDFDIGVIFKNPEKYRDNTLKPYGKLYDIFTDVLPKDYLKKRFQMKAHELDIVFLQFAPVSLQFQAITNGIVLYERSETARFNYQEEIILKNADLQYIHNLSFKCLLERI